MNTPASSKDLVSKIHQRDRRQKQVLFYLFITLIVSVIMSLRFGASSLSNQDFLSAFIGSTDTPSYIYTVIFDLRLPRILMAAAIGSLLALCGALLQGLFRNPLADPSLIGVSAGASLGASFTLFFSSFYTTLSIAPHIGELLFVSFGAFIGGALVALFVYQLARNKITGGISVASMLLAGIAISALSGSITSLIDFYADNETLRRISLWRMGSLDGASYTKVLILGSFILLSIISFPRFYQRLNAFLLGESEARHLGIDTEKTKRYLIIFVAAAVGACVAVAGAIGFIGLIVPHLMRILCGPDHRTLIPSAMIAGAILLVLADLISRTVLAPTQLPVGIITAIIGAPIFLSLLSQRYTYGGRL